MHDPNQIHKLNVQAFLQAAENARTRDGKHVLVSYDGATVTGYETFTNEQEAFDKMKEVQATSEVSEHFRMLLPSGADITVDRPQLLDGEPDADDGGILPEHLRSSAPQLTSDEESELDLAVQQRDRAEHVLRAAALRFAQEQQNCETLAEKLRTRLQADAQQQPKLL